MSQECSLVLFSELFTLQNYKQQSGHLGVPTNPGFPMNLAVPMNLGPREPGSCEPISDFLLLSPCRRPGTSRAWTPPWTK